MPSFCCILGCGSRAERDQVSFFRIPKILNFKHRKDLNELSKERQTEWLQAIRRNDFSGSKLNNARVCSKHFISGKPAALRDTLNPDWIPNIDMGYRYNLFEADREVEKANTSNI
ncbi:hypothetical protein ILUMI_12858 [Ignelater luminosus]|uniref:THAP-type domain-containing protein n=1 Tax=Ignelater luminosus TaxID=2038154 RepID=A0A8K0CZJ5_IGNLU|nr:hypothetical protein ILUMI_12858 [Ignelater luminosus]